MNKASFSIISKNHDKSTLKNLMGNLQLQFPNVKVTAAQVDKGGQESLIYVYLENLQPGDTSSIARRFVTYSTSSDDGDELLPLMSFKNFPDVDSRVKFMKKIAEHQDGETKVRVYNRNWDKD